jgi:hypothetical protein
MDFDFEVIFSAQITPHGATFRVENITALYSTDRLRSGSKAVEDDVRRQQIGSGMRGDKTGRRIASRMMS